jgi:hypothetical protein
MAVITTKQANGSFANQVFDEIVGSARKWFTLSNNLLDGTYHPIPADGSEQVGFIGAYLPDASGNIQRPALSFDSLDDYIEIPNHPSLYNTPINQWVIEAEIIPDAVSGIRVIFRKDTSGGGYYLRINEGQLQSLLHWSDGTFTERLGGTVPVGQRCTVAVTYDGSVRKHYINDAEVGSWVEGKTLFLRHCRSGPNRL